MVDPIFRHEVLQLRGKEGVPWIRLLWRRARRLNSSDLGAALSLFLLFLGFRRSREAVQQHLATFAAGVQGIVHYAADHIHIGSASVPADLSDLHQSRRVDANSSPYRGPGRRQRSRDEEKIRPLGDLKRQKTPDAGAFPSSSMAATVSASAPRAQPETKVERFVTAATKHLDDVLIFLVGYKVALLVLYTMPGEYFFGAKRRFLRWASRATLFRMYLRLAPAIGFGIVAAATAAVRLSKEPLEAGTVKRWQAFAGLNTVLTYCTLRLFELIRGDPEPMFSLEDTAHDRDVLSAEAPSVAFSRMATVPWRWLTPPVFLGMDAIPPARRKILFVGNHSIWALDVLLLLNGLYEQLGIWARPLGEHSWFSLPVVGEIVAHIGVIDGTRHNCDLLMGRGDNLLVYPGGARESWKRTTDPKYAILWKEHHVGFVLMAIRHGYSIVPVATVGTEDVFEPVVDLPISRILTAGGLLPTPKKGTSKAFDQNAKLPLVIPRLDQAQRVYFRFMPAITTAEFQGEEKNLAVVTRLRDVVRASLQEGIDFLLEHRKVDPDRFVFQHRSHL
mmetsp:Transcript_64189/g.139631  ORF Transcript_64189/g.139631 Transcript_64189/m.139631 type:complete len:560 (-) Transcript_64189:96-1775(-)